MRDTLSKARALTPAGALWPHPVTFTPLESRPDRTNAPALHLLATHPASASLPVTYSTQRYILVDNHGRQLTIIRP